MAQDPIFTITMALTLLASLAIISATALRGWRGWLDLRRAELDRFGAPPSEPARLPAGERIEMADLKERIRKLEAIAAGVDL